MGDEELKISMVGHWKIKWGKWKEKEKREKGKEKRKGKGSRKWRGRGKWDYYFER